VSKKDEIKAAVLECAQTLQRMPTQSEVEKMKGITESMIRYSFGGYTQLLSECGLRSRKSTCKLDVEKLLLDWARVVRKLKRLPSVSAYEQLSGYTKTPLYSRFGSWKLVPRAFKNYVKIKKCKASWKDVLQLIQEDEEQGCIRKSKTQMNQQKEGSPGRVLTGRPLYGALLRPYPLLHAPTNEQGVLFLFGAVAGGLGYTALRVQAGFPDCEALRHIGDDQLQRVTIECEYESRNFLKHAHDAKKCDLIVCWRHNWPECPLEVIELRTVVEKQM
jgi:hypothetical protein